jgi:hypothetical protein
VRLVERLRADADVKRWQALALVIFLAGAAMALLRRTDVDVAWLLTLGEKMLAGQRPYVDIFEANPPMSILIYLPAVLAGQGLGVTPDLMVIVLVLLGAVASLGVCSQILAPIIRSRETLWMLAALGAFVLVVLPTGVFSQREHIAVIAMLPFLSVVIARGEGARPGVLLAVLAGLGCGLAMAIKPHFALAAGLPVLTAAWRLRSWRPIVAVEIWAASLVVAAYALLLVLAFPAFLAFLPVIREAYLPVRRPLLMMLFSPPLPVWLMLGLLTAWTVRVRRGGRWIAAGLFAASAGGAASYLIQGKAWPYHAYPMLALGALALTAAFVLGRPRSERTSAPLEPLALMCLGLTVAALAVTMDWFTLKGDYRALNGPVQAIAPSPRLLSITADIAVGHPLVRELHGQWVGSVCSQWISAGVLTLEAHGGLGPGKRAQLNALMDQDRGRLAADIIRSRPDVILVDRQSFDWAAWAQADPALAAALAAYEPVRAVQGVAIWARKGRSRG